MTKPTAILDAHWRGVDELFRPADLAALHDLCKVVWGRDAPIPEALLEEALPVIDGWLALEDSRRIPGVFRKARVERLAYRQKFVLARIASKGSTATAAAAGAE